MLESRRRGGAVLLIVTRLRIPGVLFSFSSLFVSCPHFPINIKREGVTGGWNWQDRKSASRVKSKQIVVLSCLSPFMLKSPGGCVEFQAQSRPGPTDWKPSSSLPGVGFRGRSSQLLAACRECYVKRQVFVFLIHMHKHTGNHKCVSASYLESSLAGGNEPF